MSERFSRTESMLGKEAMQKLAISRIAVFGIGGVGGYVVEALARSGVGALDLIDSDKVCLSNVNRQIIATESAIGRFKVDVAAERIAQINPSCKVTTYQTFYMPETADEIDLKNYDYVVDAIDTVTGKIAIIENAKKSGVPVISCMGAGNKMDATAFEVADIYKTSVCPLAKVMRRELKKRGIDSLQVVYSKEKPKSRLSSEQTGINGESCDPSVNKKAIPASNSFVPPVAGLIIAGEVIKNLIGYYNK